MAARASAAAPVHVVLGGRKGEFDSYLAEEALRGILAAALGEVGPDSVQVLQGDETTWPAVVGAARTRSLFADRRAVVVRRADLIDRGRRDPGGGAEDDGDEEAAPGGSGGQPGARRTRPNDFGMGEYLEDPTPGVTLVLLAASPRRTLKVWRAILPRARSHSAEPLRGKALRGRVDEEVRARGLRLSAEAVQELVDEVGQDLRRLVGELDKLQAFGGGEQPLSAEDVAAVLGRGIAQPLYMLGDVMGARDASAALELIGELIQGGETPFVILPTLHRSIRLVRAALALREARAPREEIGALLPPPLQFKVPALLEATRRWSDPDLGRALAALARADRRLKRGTDAETALGAAVLEACGGARPSSRPAR